MRPCAKTGCPILATHGVRIMVPALGHPIDTHQPLETMLTVECCEAHAKELGEEVRKGVEFQQAIGAGCAAAGKAPPDFDRAWSSPIKLDHPAWIAFITRAAV